MIIRGVCALAAATLLAGCGDGGAAATGKGGPGGERGPAEVGYIVVAPADVAMIAELAGRTAAYQTSEVRPQASGLIRQRLFREGALVREGQPLFRIDSSLYRAAADEARANLSSAQANAAATGTRAQRLRPLAEMEAVSRQDYTDATAQARQAQAAVAQSRAQLDTARINLRFTTVPAPISGRIGRSLFTEGALVSATQADPLAVIQRLDPMFVDIQQASADLLRLRRALASGGAGAASAQVRIRLEDGSDYGYAGTVEFAEAMVDPATGTVTLRARFPNPQGILLPGMFVRATFAQSIDRNAFLVPQQAVTRDAKGNATLYVVGPGNKAVQRAIRTDRTEGANWVVVDGLRRGDRVITQGIAKLQPNAAIRPVPAGAVQRIAPPSGQDGGKSGAAGKAG